MRQLQAKLPPLEKRLWLGFVATVCPHLHIQRVGQRRGHVLEYAANRVAGRNLEMELRADWTADGEAGTQTNKRVAVRECGPKKKKEEEGW